VGAFVQPAPAGSVTVATSAPPNVTVGDLVYSPNGGTYQVSGATVNSVTLQRLQHSTDVATGGTVPAGSVYTTFTSHPTATPAQPLVAVAAFTTAPIAGGGGTALFTIPGATVNSIPVGSCIFSSAGIATVVAPICTMQNNAGVIQVQVLNPGPAGQTAAFAVHVYP